jgi:hypothetical protein
MGRSAVFITLHKCASVFFSRQLLPHLHRRTHVDYQWLHYEDLLRGPIAIRARGHIYGPVRILESEHPSFAITEEVISASMRKGLKAIFFVRDPRDILVSMYYSFKFSHPPSPRPDIREYQLRRRSRIQSLDLNAYVVHVAPLLHDKFARINALRRQAKCHVVLRYEDMIDDFAGFYSRWNAFVRIREGLRDALLAQTRPERTENLSRHKRLGRPGEFRQKLDAGAILRLNEIFSSILSDFRYGGSS